MAHPDLFRPVSAIDEHLRRFVRGASIPDSLRAAIDYALLGGGKRLRPMLAWCSAAAVGGKPETALPACAAVELIHAFSLVHDDLPAMDDDDMRRGRPTLHKHAGEALAILAGDAMLALAFEALHEAGMESPLAAALTRELSRSTLAMITGQVYDTLGGVPGGAAGPALARLIHENKTGALIRASCVMGARCGLGPSRDETPLLAVRRYGESIGLMYQIVDDLVDVEQSAEHAGKRTGKDARAGKTTYPGVMGRQACRAEIQRLHAEAVRAIEPLGVTAEGLRELAAFTAGRTK